MIQINLVPDLKAQHLRAQRLKQTVVSVSFVVTGVFVSLVVLLFLHVNVNQRRHSNHLNDDIANLSAQYTGVQDLSKIITVQKQLQTLPSLHADKPLMSRLAKYLSIITPASVKITNYEMLFEDNSMSISGDGKDVVSVNVFADTLKNATYKVGKDGESLPAFSNVRLDSISSTDATTAFEIFLSFDPELFKNHDTITLSVPKGDYTLSERESPSVDTTKRSTDLFNEESENGQ